MLNYMFFRNEKFDGEDWSDDYLAIGCGSGASVQLLLITIRVYYLSRLKCDFERHELSSWAGSNFLSVTRHLEIFFFYVHRPLLLINI